MQANRPIQGYDVTVSVVDANNAAVFAGEFQEASFSLKHDVEEYQTTNSRMPQLLEGDIKIEGKLKRGWLTMDLVNAIWGQSKIGPNVDIQEQHRVTITMKTNGTSSITKGVTGQKGVKLTGALFTDLNVSIKNGKAVVDKDISFRAEGIEDV
jgi:hypothetical protein